MDSASPLPRRRSCDRCYAQKVRCIPSQENPASSSDDNPDTVPCVRCVKNAHRCSYSPQRKPGRPSTSQTEASSDPTELIPRDTNTLMPNHFTVSCSESPAFVPDGNEIDPNGALHTFESLSPWLNPSTEIPSDEGKLLSRCMNGFIETNNTVERSPIGIVDAPLGHDPRLPDTLSGSGGNGSCSCDELHVSTFDQPEGLGFLGQDFGISEQRNNPICAPSSPGTAIRGLSVLSLRIYRLTQLLSTRSFDAHLSTNSPLIDNFFGVTNSLVHIIDEIVSGSHSESSECWEVGVALLVLSCHQQLLAAFEQVYAKIYRRLVKEKSSFTRRASWTTSHENDAFPDLYDQRTLSSSTIAQSVMVVKLLKHLIRRLDQSLAPIAKCPGFQIRPDDASGKKDKSDSDVSHALGLTGNSYNASSTLSPGSMSSTSAPASDKGPSGADGEDIALHSAGNGKEAETPLPIAHADTATAKFVLDAMNTRRNRLKARIGEVKSLIRSINMP